MIQTLPCPSCNRVLVLTAQASLQAVLRCRHCSHQFQLGEMIEAQLGFWEVVDDPNAPEVKVGELNESASDDAVSELTKEEYLSPQTLLKAGAEKKKTDWSKFEPITHEQYERMRRKGKSPIWSMLSVLLGGLASIPIATLLIWHVLGKDPLQMGPVVARVAPWIVPARFRPISYAEEPRTAPPAPGASGLPRLDVAMGDSSGVDASDHPASTLNNRPPSSRNAPSVYPAPSISSGLVDEESTQAEPANEPIDVFSAINLVGKDLEAWSERGEDRELKKKLALRTYSDLAALAVAINQLPSPSPIRRLVRTELNSVGQKVGEHADVQELIQRGARYWLAAHKEHLIGLAIVITAAQVTEADKSWQVTASTEVGEETIQITVPMEILSSLSEGQHILAIGCLAREKPATEAGSSEPSSSSTPVFAASYVYVLKP